LGTDRRRLEFSDTFAGLEPQTPSVDRSWGSEGVFDHREDGSQVAVPRETLLAELRQYGGRAYAGMVTFELAGVPGACVDARPQAHAPAASFLDGWPGNVSKNSSRHLVSYES
jgi:hypothetical protein